ncbi:hypothetical protein [Calidifontibacter terrae]
MSNQYPLQGPNGQQYGGQQPPQGPVYGGAQPGPQQPGYGGQQPPAYGGPPQGFIALTIQGSAMTSNMLTPNVLLDGFAVPAAYGQNTFPVPPGRHHVELYAQWMRRYGQASLEVNVAPGQSVPVFYRAPLHQFTSGSIGFEKQTAKGKGCLWGLVGVVVLFALIGLIASIAGS